MASYRWKKRTNALRSDNRDIMLNISTVLYVLMKKNDAGIHTFSGRHYKTRAALNELEQALGDSFIKVSCGCLVSVMAIHDVTKVIELTNGESRSYSTRNRNEVATQLQAKQKLIISRFSEGTIPSEEAYQAHRLCQHRNGIQRRAPGGEVISQELLTDC